MRNFYQQPKPSHPNSSKFHFSSISNETTTHSFNNNDANFQFNTSLSHDTSNPGSSILSYIDTVSPKKHQNQQSDIPVLPRAKPVMSSPNRPPPLPAKPNRLAKKLLSLNSSLNNSAILSSSTSNSVYLDLPPSSNTSLEFKSSNYESGADLTASNSTSSSPTEEESVDNYQSYSTPTAVSSKAVFNPSKMMQQLRTKNSACSSSDLLKKSSYYSNVHNDEQNERFFESNTLYKKELKKKQHDILNTSRTTNAQTPDQHQALLNCVKEPLKKPYLGHSPSNQQPTTPQSSNKMLNLFTNLISRSRSSTSQANQSFETQPPPPLPPPPLQDTFADTNCSDNNTYSNLKYLKRATSSTHLKKPQQRAGQHSVQPVMQQTGVSVNKTAFSTANLFNGRLSKCSDSMIMEAQLNNTTIETNSGFSKSNQSKYRRSFDDVSTLLATVTPADNSSHNKNLKANFENTAYSTKNNGLIFLPASANPTPSPPLRSYEKLETYDENLMKIQSPPPAKQGVQLNITDYSRPAKPEAFDNAVYNYVDNLRLHSKRLSEINLLSQSQAAAALAVAQINITINATGHQQQHQQQQQMLSRSGSSSSSPSSSVSSSVLLSSSPNMLQATFAGSVSSQSLAAAASAVEEKLNVAASRKKSDSGDGSNSRINLRGSSTSINRPSPNATFDNKCYTTSTGLPPQSALKSNISLNEPSSTSLSSASTSSHSSESSLSPPSRNTKPNHHPPAEKTSDLHSSYSTTCSSMLSDTDQRALKEEEANIGILSLAAGRIKPCLSSCSSTSSSSSASSSSSTSNYDLIEATIENSQLTRHTLVNDDTTNEVDFNFFTEFYASAVPGSDRDDFVQRKNAKFSLIFQETLNMFNKIFFTSDFYVQSLLNPTLADFNSHTTTTSSTTYSHRINVPTDFCFRFTIDYCRSTILSKIKLRETKNNSTKSGNYSFVMSDEFDCESESNTQADLETLTNSLNLTDNCYNYVINSLINNNENRVSATAFEDSNQMPSERMIKYKLVKQKLRHLLVKKLAYLSEQQKKANKVIELNEKLGARILKNLEQSTGLSQIELDKYKLLVTESDVINNLLLKLCNKLATIENSIQIIELKHLQWTKYEVGSSYSGSEMSGESTKELDMLKQEYSQIQRKKEEASFLKNGINKRATTVSEFLVNHLTGEQLSEFKEFLQMKSTNAVQLRHVKDHIDLTQLQVRLLDSLCAPDESKSC